jgi:hypothetical protein
MKYDLFFYIRSFRRIFAVFNVAVFRSFLISCFPGKYIIIIIIIIIIITFNCFIRVLSSITSVNNAPRKHKICKQLFIRHKIALIVFLLTETCKKFYNAELRRGFMWF